MKLAMIPLAISSFISTAAHAQYFTPGEAAKHVGETTKICGTVTSGAFSSTTQGRPTFLNFGQPYPNQDFTVVFWGGDRPKLGTPDELVGRRICVTGSISSFKGKPEMYLQDASQLQKEGGFTGVIIPMTHVANRRLSP